MKLLVTQYAARGRYVTREAYWIARALRERHGWQILETWETIARAEPLAELLERRFGRLPEVVLYWEGFTPFVLRLRELLRAPYRKVIFADDLHRRTEGERQVVAMALASADLVLSTYAYAFDRFYPAAARRTPVEWVPHAASPDFRLALDPRPRRRLLVSGQVNFHYPLREELVRLVEAGEPGIVHLPHPGYHCRFDHRRDPRVGPAFARRLGRHWAAFTDLTIQGYLVAKHFEIPAAGALLLAERTAEKLLRRLGFEPGRHYVATSGHDLAERVRYVLDPRNRERLDRVRRRGHALVHRWHTTERRAARIDRLCRPGRRG